MSLESKIYNFIEAWGSKVQENANKVVTETVAYAGGQAPELTNTIRTNVKVNSDLSVRWTLSMGNYWEYIEYGVNGLEKSHGSRFRFQTTHPVNQKAVLKFIEKRAITLKSLKKYGRKNFDGISLKSRKKVRKATKGLDFASERKTLTYIIGRSIKKKGIKPRPFISKIITPELRKELYDGLRAIYKEEIVATFKVAE